MSVRKGASADALPEFGDLGGQPVVGPVHFQGGVIFLRGYGCTRCGNAHWTEDDTTRRHMPGDTITCPHCDKPSVVPPA